MSQETETKDIIVTYDTLFEILRNEKTKEDLQKLHDTFFHDVTNYLNEKQNILNDNKDQKGLFESDEKEKILHQIGNIKRILTDIYERREKKIINMSVNKSRYSSNIIDTSALLDEEKLFYEMLISLLNSQRNNILDKLLKGQHLEKTEQTETKEEFKPANELPKEEPKQEESTKLVRFLTAVPQLM